MPTIDKIDDVIQNNAGYDLMVSAEVPNSVIAFNPRTHGELVAKFHELRNMGQRLYDYANIPELEQFCVLCWVLRPEITNLQ